MGRKVLEICAGGGGQALGLELAGFDAAGAVENDPAACATLRLNRPEWKVFEESLKDFDGSKFKGIDLLAGGVPCPPFSIAGKQLGGRDDRDLFPYAISLLEQTQPAALMLENVRGLASARFDGYLTRLLAKIRLLRYEPTFAVLNASSFGVPQLRPRFVLVAMKSKYAKRFKFPEEVLAPLTVGQCLHELMASRGWRGADKWAKGANRIAPTLVGGSKKHGGPDLGPTRAKREWATLGVDGMGVVDLAPDAKSPRDLRPRLTVRMAARIQGFPDWWEFSGKKTNAYRQVGNAFPPPVAAAVGLAIQSALDGKRRSMLPILTELLRHPESVAQT